MPSIDAHPDLDGRAERVVRTLSHDVLAPIPGNRPTGSDVREGKQWVVLMKVRPRPSETSAPNNESGIAYNLSDWSEYRDALEKTLCTMTKDLELGIFLTEANTRVHGFDGLRDAFWMLGGLISGFVQDGLHPRPTNGDLGELGRKLDWLNEKLSDVISEIPLTRRPEPGRNYSLNYFKESRRQDGMITAAEFDDAAAAGSAEEYKALLASILGVEEELLRFKNLASEVFGQESSSFPQTDETLALCRAVLESILRRHRKNSRLGADSGASPLSNAARAEAQPERSAASLDPVAPFSGGGAAANGDDRWSACEQIAHSGNIDGAIAAMAALASSEPNGRVRFQRRLMLADLCLQTNRKRLGTSILEELNQTIEFHKLENWETSQIVGGVWARLVRCYRDKAAGTGDPAREAEFFLKLSRLDPWQAVACGEPKREV